MRRIRLATVVISSAIAVALLGGLSVAAYQSHRALKGSQTLVIGKIVTHAVERFVSERGDWPRSWSDLDGISDEKFTASMRETIVVDFDADLDDLAGQSAGRFNAIRPRMVLPSDYRDYWEFESLLSTVRGVRDQPAGH